MHMQTPWGRDFSFLLRKLLGTVGPDGACAAMHFIWMFGLSKTSTLTCKSFSFLLAQDRQERRSQWIQSITQVSTFKALEKIMAFLDGENEMACSDHIWGSETGKGDRDQGVQQAICTTGNPLCFRRGFFEPQVSGEQR
uniref:Uncharacterized protein n=1 Tax=Sphaerodactylus townsendi TaxID=933632 RepID=A0ACB8EFJ8_9SAUR